MVRVQENRVQKSDDKFCRDGRLFSGILFQLSESGIVQPRMVREGEVVGDYESICAKQTVGIEQVDLTGQIEDYELQKFNGSLFSGIGYSFSSGFCVCEALFDSGVSVAEAHWDLTGALTRFTRSNDGMAESYKWFSNSKLESATVTTTSEYSGTLVFAQNGALRRLLGRRGFFENIPMIARSSKFFPVSSLEEILRLTCDKEVLLRGEEIDDKFVDLLLGSGTLLQVQRLAVAETKLSGFGLSQLCSLPDLKELNVIEKSDARRKALEAAIDNDAGKIVRISRS